MVEHRSIKANGLNTLSTTFRKLRITLWRKRAERRTRSGDLFGAFSLRARAANAGDPECQASIGAAYLEGKGVACSHNEAARWLMMAALKGQVDAQVKLARLHLAGGVGLQPASDLFASAGSEPNIVEAKRWAELAANAGSPYGQALVASLLLSASNDMLSRSRAMQLYRTAADAGSMEACLGLWHTLVAGRSHRKH